MGAWEVAIATGMKSLCDFGAYTMLAQIMSVSPERLFIFQKSLCLLSLQRK